MESQRSPEMLAEELLGRAFADLDTDERNVLIRVASGTLTGLDADERAQAHASRGGVLRTGSPLSAEVGPLS